MPRQARLVADGVPHHITQRGNNRQEVFLLDEDRRFYLDNLRLQARRHGVRLLGYCLMSNQVHLVAVPERPDGLALALGQFHGAYPQRFNRRYRHTGHLWQNRFYSCPLGPSHLWRALMYVDLNPVRAGMLSDPTAYPGRARLPMPTTATLPACWTRALLKSWKWGEVDPGGDWKQLLQTRALEATESASLRTATYHGRPFGDALFAKTLEARLAASSLSRRAAHQKPVPLRPGSGPLRRVQPRFALRSDNQVEAVPTFLCLLPRAGWATLQGSANRTQRN